MRRGGTGVLQMFATFGLEAGWYQEGGDVGALRLFEPEPVEPLACSEDWSVEQAIEEYIGAKCPNKQTAAGYRTLARKWGLWMRNLRCSTPKVPHAITTEDLQKFLDWVQRVAEDKGQKNPENTRNKLRMNLHAVWNWLAAEGRLPSVVRFPDPVPCRRVAGQFFFERREVSALYEAAGRMQCPRLWRDPRPISHLWQAAIVLFWFYAFDTRALFYESGKQQITWDHIYRQPLPPGRAGNVRAKYGWIRWKRQKTGVVLLLPIHPVVHRHLDLIRPQGDLFDRGAAIIGRAGGTDPNERFRELVCEAGLSAKIDPETGQRINYVLKDLRKTAATYYGDRDAGLILGHVPDSITARHYENPLPRIVRAVKRVKYPRAFRDG
jgi:hypothetical protein